MGGFCWDYDTFEVAQENELNWKLPEPCYPVHKLVEAGDTSYKLRVASCIVGRSACYRSIED